MNRKLAIALLVVITVLLACSGGVTEGAPCTNPGDVYAKDGSVYHCKLDKHDRLRWGK